MPIYPVKNNRNGKTYDMPWDKDDPPTSIDAMQFIDKIEHPSLIDQAKDVAKTGWNKLNEPLSDLPSRMAKKVSEPLYEYGETTNPKGMLGKAARVGGAYAESLGNVGDSLTSPLSLGLTALTGGSGLAAKAGLARTAQALAVPGRVAAGGMVAHGGYNAARPGATTSERLGGVVEGGLGLLGLRGPEVKAPIPDIADKPFGPMPNPETRMSPYANPNLGTSKPGMPIQEGIILGENPPPPPAPKQLGPYRQPQLPPPPPERLALPPKGRTFYGGPAGGPVAEDITAVPERAFAGGPGRKSPTGKFQKSAPMEDVTPRPPVRDILEQTSPYNRILRGSVVEPPSESPQYARPKPPQPLGNIGPEPVGMPTPVEPPPQPVAKPKPTPAPKVKSIAEATGARPFAKASDADVEFLASTGEPGALDEARLRPSLKEKLGHLFKPASDVAEGPVRGAAIPDIQPVKPPPGPEFVAKGEEVPYNKVAQERAPKPPQVRSLSREELAQKALESKALPDIPQDVQGKPIELPTPTPQPTAPTTKPPLGDPGSPERYKYVAWEQDQAYQKKAAKLEELKAKDPATIDWNKEWGNNPRVKSLKDAQAEVDFFKKKATEARSAAPTGETPDIPHEDTSPALDDRTFSEKFMGRLAKLKGEEGKIVFGPGEHDNLAKANKIKAKDWSTQREAANHHGEFARSDFKDLADKPELVDKFQSGDRSGRLKDVAAHFDRLYQEELDAGIFTGKKMPKENYLRQSYKPELIDEETAPAVKGGTVPKTPAFAKKSTFATFAEARAAGHEPLYDNLADIIGARTAESKRAIANKRFDTYLNETQQKTPEMTIKEPTQLRFSGPMAKQLGGYTSNVLQDSPDWLHNIAAGVAKTKNVYLAGGIPGTPLNIHGWNIARSRYMASGAKGIEDFTKGVFRPSADRATLIKERPLIQKAIDYGYQMSSEQEHQGALEKLLEGNALGRAVNKGMDLTKKVFEDPLFKVSLPANKARVLRENYDRLLPKVGEEQALRQASTIANDFMGGINKSLRNKTLKDLLQIGILAPDWAESRINLTVKGVKALAGKEDPIYAKALARGGVMRGAGAAAQLGIGEDRGKKPSDLTSVGLGKTESGKYREFPIYGTAVEGLRLPEEALRGAASGDFSPVSRILRNRLSQPLQSAHNIVYNQDAFGNPLSGKDKYNQQIPATKAVGNYANELTASLQPQQLQSLIGYYRGKQGGEEALSQSFELPLKYSTQPSTGSARRSRNRGRGR